MRTAGLFLAAHALIVLAFASSAHAQDSLDCTDVERLRSQAHHEQHIAKNLPVAIELRLAVVACEPTAKAYESLGGALAMNRQDEEAEAAFRTALTLDPHPVVEFRALGQLAGVLERRGDYEGAIDYASQSIGVAGDRWDYPTAHAIRAQAYAELGRFHEALADRTSITEIYPHSWHAFYSRGLVFLELGLLDRAADDFEKATDLNPDRAEPKAALEGTPRIAWTMAPRYQLSWNAFDGDTHVDLDPDDPRYRYYTEPVPTPDPFDDDSPPSRGYPQGIFDRSMLFPADGYTTTVSACGATEWLVPNRVVRWKFSVVSERPRPETGDESAVIATAPLHTTVNPGPSEPSPYTVGCTWTGPLPEGNVQVTVEPVAGEGSLTDTIRVENILIVSIGDSIASGEGDGPFVNARCHRTNNNLHARAAEKLEAQSDQWSVTFVSLACSGAKVDSGLLTPYGGKEWGYPKLPSQVDQLADLLCFASCINQPGAPQVDMLLVSAGANDLKFSAILEDCVENQRCDADFPNFEDNDLLQTIRDELYLADVDKVTANANDLVEGTNGFRSFFDVRTALTSRGIEPRRTIVTQYNTELFSANSSGGEYEVECVGEGAPLHQLRISEARFITEELAPILKSAVERGAERAGWEVTNDPSSLFWGRGMCKSKRHRWIVQIDISDGFFDTGWGLGFGGLKEGYAHPNVPGHQALADHLVEHIGSWRPSFTARNAGVSLTDLE